MTTISNNDIARAIYREFTDAGHEGVYATSQKVVNFLFRKNLISKSGTILTELEKVINREEGRTVARVTSVKPLTEKSRTHLAHIFKKRYSAKEVELIESLDIKLLGGVRIEVNDEIIDFSIKNKIKKLQAYLTRPE